MTLDEKIQFYLDRQPTQTRWISLVLNSSMVGGIPIGQGKCKGVRLSANHFKLYDTTRQSDDVAAKFYFGDSDQQSKEYLINTDEDFIRTNQRDSGFIPCTDLSQVWVRFTDEIVISEAQERIVVMQVNAQGTTGQVLHLNGVTTGNVVDLLDPTTETDINQGSGGNTFADEIDVWAHLGDNLTLSGADTIQLTDPGEITITYPTGTASNSIENFTDDLAISFTQLQPGTDAVLGSIQIEIEISE